MEKRDVSSTKSLAVVDKLSDRSLTLIKINSGPSMEPCDTPASVLSQGFVHSKQSIVSETKEISDNIRNLV